MSDATIRKARTFGQGFGELSVSVYTETGPRTGLLFDSDEMANKAVCGVIQNWLGSGSGSLDNALENSHLIAGLHNRLIHADMVDMLRWAPQIYKHLPEESRDALLGKANLERVHPNMWEAINNSRTPLPPVAEAEKLKAAILRRKDIAAATLPVLFGALPQDEQAHAAKDIAKALHKGGLDKEFFAPLANPDINRLLVANKDEPLTTKNIVNNRRAIQVNPNTDTTRPRFSVTFQGQTFYPAQFHFHRARSTVPDGKETAAEVRNTRGQPDGTLEYKLYRNREHEAACKAGHAADPNDEAVGELHIILVAPGKHNTALSLNAQVKLGNERNEAFETYLAPLRKRNAPLAPDEAARFEGSIPFKPFDCFNHGSFTDGSTDLLPEAPFVSLNLGSFHVKDGVVELRKNTNPVFSRGVHVVHLPQESSITISRDQLEVLERALPALQPIDVPIRPIGRAM